MKLISVIVPMYNSGSYIKRCLESIINQTYKDIEIILVDDGSNDNTDKICLEYAMQDKRINYIRLVENKGVAIARNVGLDNIKGEYIAFVDADDYIVPNYLEVLYNNLEKTSSDISICNFKYVDMNLKDTKLKKRACNFESSNKAKIDDKKIEVLDDNIKFYNIYNERHTQTVVSWCKLCKKEVFYNLRYVPNSCHEDMFITHYMLNNAKKIVYTNEVLYWYVQREGSTKDVFKVERLDILKSEYDRIEFFRAVLKDEGLYKKALNSCCNSLIIHYCLLKKYIKDNETYLEDVYDKFQFYYDTAKRYDCIDGDNKDKYEFFDKSPDEYFDLYIEGED